MIENLGSENTGQPSLPDVETVELFPYGFSLGPQISRPVLIFQDESGKLRVPIWLKPIEAAVSLSILDDHGAGSTPHGVLGQLLDQLNVRVEKCVLDEVQGHRQFGSLHFKSRRKRAGFEPLRRSADEIVTVGLVQRARFYASAEFVRKSRDMNEEILNVEAQLKAFPAAGAKPHHYLM